MNPSQSFVRRMVRSFRPEGIPWPASSFYNKLSSSSIYRHHYELVVKDVLALCPTGKLLDVGTGPGRLLIALQTRECTLQLCGIDLSPSMVETAKANLATAGAAADVDVRVGNVCHIPYEDNLFDIVVSTASLHRWSRPIEGLNELHRVLKPGGHALIYDIVSDTPYAQLRDMGRAFGRMRLGLFWFRGFAESFYSQEGLGDLARRTSFGDCKLDFVGILCRMTLFKMGGHATILVNCCPDM